MLNLFALDDNWQVQIRPETLLLKPFKKVMDKYKERRLGLSELAYVYYMADYRSDYNHLTDLEFRSEKIKEVVIDVDKLKFNKTTEEAINFYNELQPSISLRHLEAMKKALSNLQGALNNLDLSQQVLNDKDELIEMYDTLALNRIATIIEKSPKIISAIKDMEKQVKTELQENTTHVGSGEKGIYEDD